MVSKLILAGVALEEAVKVDITTAKLGSIVSWFQPTDANLELRLTHEKALSELQWAGLPGRCGQRFQSLPYRSEQAGRE